MHVPGVTEVEKLHVTVLRAGDHIAWIRLVEDDLVALPLVLGEDVEELGPRGLGQVPEANRAVGGGAGDQPVLVRAPRDVTSRVVEVHGLSGRRHTQVDELRKSPRLEAGGRHNFLVKEPFHNK